jgi:hypothetical protein
MNTTELDNVLDPEDFAIIPLALYQNHYMYLRTYLFTYGAEPFLRSRQLCSPSRTSLHFMEPERSIPCLQEPYHYTYCVSNCFTLRQTVWAHCAEHCSWQCKKCFEPNVVATCELYVKLEITARRT